VKIADAGRRLPIESDARSSQIEPGAPSDLFHNDMVEDV
jgi:hypothetical protein